MLRFRRPQAEPLELNLTPLIDCLLFLIVVLLLTTSFNHPERLRLVLPEAQGQAAPQNKQQRIRVTVDANNQYTVNGKSIEATTVEPIKMALLEAITKPRAGVSIQADGRASHQAVVRVMDAAGQAGISSIDIATLQSDRRKAN